MYVYFIWLLFLYWKRQTYLKPHFEIILAFSFYCWTPFCGVHFSRSVSLKNSSFRYSLLAHFFLLQLYCLAIFCGSKFILCFSQNGLDVFLWWNGCNCNAYQRLFIMCILLIVQCSSLSMLNPHLIHVVNHFYCTGCIW